MPALAADIAAAMREMQIVTWTSATIADRYPGARDGSLTPAGGYCDSAVDAQILVNARGALIGVERNRFAVDIADTVWPDLSAGVPADLLTDAEQLVDAVHLVARIELNLDAETTSHELLG